MQLVAYGAQDIYLTGNPQITFFKVVYRRHTNFSMEEVAQTPDGNIGFDKTASFTISRNGDLVHKMYFEFSPNDMFKDVTINTNSNTKLAIGTYIGNTLLKEIRCEIGGQKIDEQTGEFMQFYNDLYDSTWSKLCMIGHERSLILPSTKIDKQYISYSMVSEKLKSEGWLYFQLSGKYTGSTHKKSFHSFCEKIERIKMKQVNLDFLELSKKKKKERTY